MNPDTITPDLALGIVLLLLLALLVFATRDRGRDRRELLVLYVVPIEPTALTGACLSHNLTCTHPEPHDHGPACDRSCVCVRTAA